MMAPASPGTLSRIDEMRPPYSQPSRPRQQDQRRLGRQLHREGQRHQDGDAVDGPQAGQQPDDGADQGANRHDQQVHRRQRDAEADHQVLQGFHQRPPSRTASRPVGSTTSSSLSNSRTAHAQARCPPASDCFQLPPKKHAHRHGHQRGGHREAELLEQQRIDEHGRRSRRGALSLAAAGGAAQRRPHHQPGAAMASRPASSSGKARGPTGS
jgi:hypothetical protein